MHEWHDVGALLDAVPQSARDVGFGGVGRLVDTVRDLAREGGADTGHKVSAVRVGGWDRYRVDVTLSPWPAGWGDDADRSARTRYSQWRTLACDGERCWKVYSDRVVSEPVEPLAGDLVDMFDTSWLLSYELSGGEEVVVDGGRRGYRVVVRHAASWSARMPPFPSLLSGLSAVGEQWAMLYFPAVAVVDAESGRLLRLTRFKAGKPVLRQELRDLVGLDSDVDFGFTPPAGVPVEDETGD
jgi:hypothetical protein